MICPNCGNENANDVSQCTFCGQRFAPKDPRPQAADTGTSDSGHTYTSKDPHTENTAGTGSGPNDPGRQGTGRYHGQNHQGWYDRNNQGWSNPNYQNNQNWNYQNNQGFYGPNSPGGQGWYNPDNQGWQPQPKDPNRGFSLASLIIGIVSIVFLCTMPFLSLPLNIVGIVLGIIALKKPGRKPVAIAGICVNAVILVASIIMLIMVFYIILNIDQFNSFYNDFYNSYYDSLFIALKNRLY